MKIEKVAAWITVGTFVVAVVSLIVQVRKA